MDDGSDGSNNNANDNDNDGYGTDDDAGDDVDVDDDDDDGGGSGGGGGGDDDDDDDDDEDDDDDDDDVDDDDDAGGGSCGGGGGDDDDDEDGADDDDDVDDSENYSRVTSRLFFLTAPGGPPRNIRAWGVSDTSFGASWLPPLELNGRLEMYHLIYSTDLEKDYSQWRFKPEASNYTVVEGLKSFTTYYFRMVAYTRVGRGPPTEMFVVKTGKGG